MPGLTNASESTVNRIEGEGAQSRGRTSQIQVLEGAQMKNFGDKKVVQAAEALIEMLRKVTDPEEKNTIFARAKTARAPRNDFDQVRRGHCTARAPPVRPSSSPAPSPALVLGLPRRLPRQVMEAYIELLGADKKLAADAMELLRKEVSELLSHLPKLVETLESNGEAIVTAKLWMLKDKGAHIESQVSA